LLALLGGELVGVEDDGQGVAGERPRGEDVHHLVVELGVLHLGTGGRHGADGSLQP
jgi:hypothetical protein